MASTRLSCRNGTVTARIGDRFTDRGVQWEIASFGTLAHAHATLGVMPTVYCKPISKVPRRVSLILTTNGTAAWPGEDIAIRLMRR